MVLRKLNMSYLINCMKCSRRLFRTSPLTFKIIQFLLTDIGEGIREVELKNWLVKVGDEVKQFDNICLVESDKASVHISSRYDGIIKKLYYNEGDRASVGKPLVDIETEDLAADTKRDLKVAERKLQEKVVFQSPDVKGDTYSRKPLATPSVRRMAMEKNIKLDSVEGSGKHGRILREDIENYFNKLEVTAEPELKVQHSIKTVLITGVQKVMVKTMTSSNSIPTFSCGDSVNITKLINSRNEVKKYAQEKGIAFTFMPFFIKALSKVLERFPLLNASVDEKCEYISYKSEHNVGIAMDTPKGLVVPNIKNVQNLSILHIGIELNRLIKNSKEMNISPKDLSGGTITLSNVGMMGGSFLQPLILPPEICILALGGVHIQPVFNEKDEIVKGHVMNAFWSSDHRVVDGATLARASNAWKNYIENPTLLMLDL